MAIGLTAIVRVLNPFKKPGPGTPTSKKPLGKIPEIFTDADSLKF